VTALRRIRVNRGACPAHRKPAELGYEMLRQAEHRVSLVHACFQYADQIRTGASGYRVSFAVSSVRERTPSLR
jgi:hypothetical protein